MIKEIIKYQIEGSNRIFNSLEEAKIFEEEAILAKEAIELLGGDDPTIDFANGKGVIQISSNSYDKAKAIYRKLLLKRFGSEEVHPRVIDDSDKSSELNSLAYIFSCIVNEERFYVRVGQPYFTFDLSRLESSEIIKIVN